MVSLLSALFTIRADHPRPLQRRLLQRLRTILSKEESRRWSHLRGTSILQSIPAFTLQPGHYMMIFNQMGISLKLITCGEYVICLSDLARFSPPSTPLFKYGTPHSHKEYWRRSIITVISIHSFLTILLRKGIHQQQTSFRRRQISNPSTIKNLWFFGTRSSATYISEIYKMRLRLSTTWTLRSVPSIYYSLPPPFLAMIILVSCTTHIAFGSLMRNNTDTSVLSMSKITQFYFMKWQPHLAKAVLTSGSRFLTQMSRFTLPC